MNLVEIKKASLADLQELQLIGKQTFQETFAEVNSEENIKKYLADSFNDRKITDEIENPNSEFYIAIIDNQTIGYLKVNFGTAQTELKDPKGMELERIYVLRKYHGEKVGQLLFEKALQIATNKKVEYLWLGVWEKNIKAKKFYLKNGFIEFDKHIFRLGNDEQTDIMMKLVINAKN